MYNMFQLNILPFSDPYKKFLSLMIINIYTFKYFSLIYFLQFKIEKIKKKHVDIF